MDRVIEDLKEIAMNYRVNKIILFGSRARGDHSLVSDYDFAVFEKHLSTLDKARFCTDVDEIETLKKIDIVFVQENTTDELMKRFKRDGVIVYEQIANQVK